jgi:hypothetical protein
MLTLGTTIVYYSAAEVSMAHGLGTAVTAALVWYWLRTWGSTDPKRWLLVGGLVGLAALARWQLAALAVLPAGEAVLACGRSWRRVGAALAGLALAGAASLAAFLPQMIAWRCVYGDWVVAPMPLAHNWLEPAWFRVLLAQDRSLFYWTPLTLLPLLGYLTCFRPGWQPPVLPQRPPSTRGPLLVLIAACTVQVYFMASVSGPGVFLGAGYGYRQLTEALVLLAPGLALLLESGPLCQRRFVAILGCLLVLWNLLLIDQFWAGFLPANAGVDLGTLCANVGRFTTRGFLFFALLATPFLLAVLPLGRSGMDA